jgi:7-carboxy-7-deazaguanine synthase
VRRADTVDASRYRTSVSYLVKEIFGPTLQGEGAHAGSPCVFLRFAVCNLACSWCDTDFAAEGASHLEIEEIVARLVTLDEHRSRMVVVTGGEPTLQWDVPLADAVRAAGFRVHMESNGTRALAAPVDWLTVSPKPQFHEGRFDFQPALPISEIKVVVDDTVSERTLAAYEERWPGVERWFVQPCAGVSESLRRSIDLATRRPRWRLSVQLHKIIDVP